MWCGFGVYSTMRPKNNNLDISVDKWQMHSINGNKGSYEATLKRINETAGLKKQNTMFTQDVHMTVTIWWCGHTDTEWQNFPRQKLSDEHRSTICNFHPQSFTFSKQIQVQPSDTWPSLCICSCYWLKSPDKSQHKQQVGGSESLEEGTLAGFKVALRNSWL